MTTQNTLFDIDSVREVPRHRNNIDEGYRCKCCGSFIKRYRRKLLSNMAYVLVLLYREGIRDWVHVEKWLIENGHQRSGDFHKLVHWNLLDKLTEDRPDGSSRNGYYRLNGKSILFVEGKLKVRQVALILNGKFEGFEGGEINVHDALGSKFNYAELMGITSSQSS